MATGKWRWRRKAFHEWVEIWKAENHSGSSSRACKTKYQLSKCHGWCNQSMHNHRKYIFYHQYIREANGVSKRRWVNSKTHSRNGQSHHVKISWPLLTWGNTDPGYLGAIECQRGEKHVKVGNVDTVGTSALWLLESPLCANLIQEQPDVVFTISDTERDII